MTEKNQEPGQQVTEEPIEPEGGEHVPEESLEPEDCQQALEACRRESEERLQALLRARADLDNQAKRFAREFEKAQKYALSELIQALLPVKDSLELSMQAVDTLTDVETLRQGTALTLEALESVLVKFGVEIVDPLGEPFDPERHEAISMTPVVGLLPNSVAQVPQKGYLLNGRLLRPARVIVSTAPVASDNPDAPDNPSS